MERIFTFQYVKKSERKSLEETRSPIQKRKELASVFLVFQVFKWRPRTTPEGTVQDGLTLRADNIIMVHGHKMSIVQ